MNADDILKIEGVEGLTQEGAAKIASAVSSAISEESNTNATRILDGVVSEIQPLLGEDRNAGEKTSDYIKRVLPVKIQSEVSVKESEISSLKTEMDVLKQKGFTDDSLKQEYDSLKDRVKTLEADNVSITKEKDKIVKDFEIKELKTEFKGLLPELDPTKSKSTKDTIINSAFNQIVNDYDSVYLNSKGELMVKKDYTETPVSELVGNMDSVKDIMKPVDQNPNPNQAPGAGAGTGGGFEATKFNEGLEGLTGIERMSKLQSLSIEHLKSKGIDKNHPDFTKNLQETVKANQ